ncbi:ORC1-type DNA replication protein [Methanofollis formosanus]|uniref:ORC1-type DNA replication protein n=1 Tax=Methanofollis formosanus TaxID=299308 RepID=A0A8G1A2P3_9EURY|nr:ORC1-type DNA replication protein [Methanofollis formosanus]QYZ79926.1 ORC1-type DNA replication protein [Methanofollis formosanus]
MKKDLLMWDETLFRDPEVFEIDYVPEQFNHRETQMRELAFQITPGLRGGRPLNTICRGLPGTGKTTSVRKLLGQVEEHESKLVPVYINCQIDNTKFAVFAQIYQKLSGRHPPASGTSFKQIFDFVARRLQKEEKVLLVALDDANYLLYENEINKILYPLLRSHEAYPGTRIGVITIISDMNVDLSREVDPRVASVFRPTEIYFPPYGTDEVRHILSERVMTGLYPGALSDAMLDLVVEQTMKSGDLRVGLDLLKRATLNAETAARRQVEEDDICRAYEVSKYLHLTFTLRTLKDEEKDLMRIIATLSREKDEKEEMNAGGVYEKAKEHMKLGYTRYYEIVKKLDAMRLINLNYRQGRGRTRVISLRYDPNRILKLLV